MILATMEKLLQIELYVCLPLFTYIEIAVRTNNVRKKEIIESWRLKNPKNTIKAPTKENEHGKKITLNRGIKIFRIVIMLVIG